VATCKSNRSGKKKRIHEGCLDSADLNLGQWVEFRYLERNAHILFHAGSLTIAQDAEA
jgi:hypothetical protein